MKPTYSTYWAEVHAIKCHRCGTKYGPYLDAERLVNDALSEEMWEFDNGDWLCGKCVEEALEAQSYFHNRQPEPCLF